MHLWKLASSKSAEQAGRLETWGSAAVAAECKVGLLAEFSLREDQSFSLKTFN